MGGMVDETLPYLPRHRAGQRRGVVSASVSASGRKAGANANERRFGDAERTPASEKGSSRAPRLREGREGGSK